VCGSLQREELVAPDDGATGLPRVQCMGQCQPFQSDHAGQICPSQLPDSQKSESTVFVKNHGRYVSDATQYRLLPDAMCRFGGVSEIDAGVACRLVCSQVTVLTQGSKLRRMKMQAL